MLASNLQFLRRKHQMTQEDLANRMGVSRQTISKWESADVLPELSKALQLSEIFACPLDALLKEDLSPRVQEEIRLIRLEGFRLAQYVMISPNARQDAMDHMAKWAERHHLEPKLLGWPFPYVSEQQKDRFGLKGYVGACVLPEALSPASDGPEICRMEGAVYAVLTCQLPGEGLSPAFSWAVPRILEYLESRGIRKTIRECTLPCFQRQYASNGNWFAEYYVQCEGPEPSLTLQF